MTKKILIVDTDKGFSTILSEGLNSDVNFNAAVVHSSTAALQFVVEKAIDMVIVDLGIDDMPAQKLITAIREAKSDMPIMVTPVIGQDVPSDIKSLKTQGVIPKPFFVGDLPRIVGEGLGLDLDSKVPDLPPVVEDTAKSKSTTKAKPRAAERAAERNSNNTGNSAVVAEAVAPVAVVDTVSLSTLPSWKLERLRKSGSDIVSQLDDMNRELRAEVILLTAGSELIAKAGTMRDDRVQELALLVAKGAEAAAQAAAFLGERVKRFEQSIHEGSEYRLYSYSLGEGVVLSLASSKNVPLGMLRHQTKRTSQALAKEYID